MKKYTKNILILLFVFFISFYLTFYLKLYIQEPIIKPQPPDSYEPPEKIVVSDCHKLFLNCDNQSNNMEKSDTCCQNEEFCVQCIQNMNEIAGYNLSIVLNNGDILIRGDTAEVAEKNNRIFEIFDRQTYKFSIIPDTPVIDFMQPFIELENGQYYVVPDYIYDSNTNTFSKVTDERLHKYKRFIEKRKSFQNKTQLITTLANKKLVYCGLDKNYNCIELWAENPYTLYRSPYTALNIPRNSFSETYLPGKSVIIVGGYNSENANKALSLDDYLPSIEIYEPKANKITLYNNLIPKLYASDAIVFDKNKLLIAGYTRDRADTRPEKLSITIIDLKTKQRILQETLMVNIKYQNFLTINTIKITDFSTDKKNQILITGIYNGIYNINTNKLTDIKAFKIPELATITRIGSGKALITGGLELHPLTPSFANYNYKTAMILTAK
jgi:hypothetical protein